MNPELKSVLIGISTSVIAAVIGGLSALLWKRWRGKSLRKTRLKSIHEASREDEIAICVRVGGKSAALPDVEDYLKTKLVSVKEILSYNIATSDLEPNQDLGQPVVAAAIVEDIIEGLEAYGKGKLTRVHFFPAGILAYAPIAIAMMTNWSRVVVYHLTENGYVPLYEITKDSIHRTRRIFASLKPWETSTIEQEVRLTHTKNQESSQPADTKSEA